MTSIIVEVAYNGENWTMLLQKMISLKTLTQFSYDMFPELENSKINFTYVDEEDDTIYVSRQCELDEAYRLKSAQELIDLKFEVVMRGGITEKTKVDEIGTNTEVSDAKFTVSNNMDNIIQESKEPVDNDKFNPFNETPEITQKDDHIIDIPVSMDIITNESASLTNNNDDIAVVNNDTIKVNEMEWDNLVKEMTSNAACDSSDGSNYFVEYEDERLLLGNKNIETESSNEEINDKEESEKDVIQNEKSSEPEEDSYYFDSSTILDALTNFVDNGDASRLEDEVYKSFDLEECPKDEDFKEMINEMELLRDEVVSLSELTQMSDYKKEDVDKKSTEKESIDLKSFEKINPPQPPTYNQIHLNSTPVADQRSFNSVDGNNRQPTPFYNQPKSIHNTSQPVFDNHHNPSPTPHYVNYSTPSQNPLEHHESQRSQQNIVMEHLKNLTQMGFVDQLKNLELLEKYPNNIDAVVNELIDGSN